jgi:D-tagatose-bisphosphate aldolase class II non-catalytic subunit
MTIRRIADTARDRQAGAPIGIASICRAHPMVIEAALLRGGSTGETVLIEATCNQVNQEGGYTGMTPADFRRFVEQIADRIGFEREHLNLGGDHLGPHPWKHLPTEEAMGRAEAIIASNAKAGFTKLHLDASMGCAGESIARRATSPRAASPRRAAARLALAAEASVDGLQLSYVIGTEVPVPGGALKSIERLDMTRRTLCIQSRFIAPHSLPRARRRRSIGPWPWSCNQTATPT